MKIITTKEALKIIISIAFFNLYLDPILLYSLLISDLFLLLAVVEISCWKYIGNLILR